MHTLDTVSNTWAAMHQSNFEVSGWGGFTNNIYPGFRDNARSRIIVLSFALDVPSKLSTIYSCLKFARENTCMNALIATFDQPLCAKAIDICARHPSLFKNSLIGRVPSYNELHGLYRIYYVRQWY